jgi:DNA-directed RNA polymerase subunit RPC12/RpoP
MHKGLINDMAEETTRETLDTPGTEEDGKKEKCPECGEEILVKKGNVAACLSCGREFLL